MSRLKEHTSVTSRMPLEASLTGTVAGLAVVVMAAGLGKRMQSKHAKVLHPIAGRAMVLYSVELGLRVAGHRVVVVVGHQADQVRQVVDAATSGSN
ncbi:MAG TPA: NTP transferase domain-containing protein, partial [Nitrospira sp.]